MVLLYTYYYYIEDKVLSNRMEETSPMTDGVEYGMYFIVVSVP
jgi:hypothetical protein